jgi:hypothetical protein
LPLSKTVNVTVPAPTVPPALVTVADNVTVWFVALKFAEAFDAVVVVETVLTVSVWVVSLLAAKFPPPLYDAWIEYVPIAVPPGRV